VLTQEIIRELLHYNPKTGVFTWRKRNREWFKNDGGFKMWNKRFPGETTGCAEKSGYLQIGLFGKLYYAHRLAFLYMTGEFPTGETDHINGLKGENIWDNLRDVTRKENGQNKAIHKNNTSGITGVHWSKSVGKWYAKIKVSGQEIGLGYFIDIDDATKVRKAAEIQYGFHQNHGRQRIMTAIQV